MSKILAGEKFPVLQAKTIHGQAVSVPALDGRLTHLQFRRFAGCPICNLHLRAFVARHEEIVAAGVREVVVFHSSDVELLPYQGEFPFAVIGDPGKALYKRYGISTSLRAILDPRAWPGAVRGNLQKDRPELKRFPNGGPLGLPADFLIATDGTVVAAHYGSHADDQWSVDEMLTLARPLATVR